MPDKNGTKKYQYDASDKARDNAFDALQEHIRVERARRILDDLAKKFSKEDESRGK